MFMVGLVAIFIHAQIRGMRCVPSTWCQIVAWNIGDSNERTVYICSQQFFRFSVEFFNEIHMTWARTAPFETLYHEFSIACLLSWPTVKQNCWRTFFIARQPATCVIKMVLWFNDTTKKCDPKNCAAHSYSPVIQSYMNSLRRNATWNEEIAPMYRYAICHLSLGWADVSCEQQNVWLRHAR